MKATPRLRMFAGPNGSGKSTIKAVVEANIGKDLLGIYINADEIEEAIRPTGLFDLSDFGVKTSAEEILGFFRRHPLLRKEGYPEKVEALTFDGGELNFSGIHVDSYFAAVAADFIREKLLESGVTFTFETVMSHDSKIKFLRKAQEHGYRTYLYYVATEDPEINVSRVANRVATGGHNVLPEKVRSRYRDSLSLLYDAVLYSSRAYIFDNSSSDNVCIAEVTGGAILEFKTDAMPYWFQTALWDKFGADKESGD